MKKLILVLILAFLLVSFAENQAETKVYLIRHAEKVDASKNPKLSEKGNARAENWAKFFKNKKIDVVLSTDYIRTRETAKPIAAKFRIEIEIYNPTATKLKNIIAKYRGKNIVIVGHSNSTPTLVNDFINQEIYAPIEENEFGNLYTIKVTKNSIKHCLKHTKF